MDTDGKNISNDSCGMRPFNIFLIWRSHIPCLAPCMERSLRFAEKKSGRCRAYIWKYCIHSAFGTICDHQWLNLLRQGISLGSQFGKSGLGQFYIYIWEIWDNLDIAALGISFPIVLKIPTIWRSAKTTVSTNSQDTQFMGKIQPQLFVWFFNGMFNPYQL